MTTQYTVEGLLQAISEFYDRDSSALVLHRARELSATTPQPAPGNDAVRALVAKWRARKFAVALAFADELEAALANPPQQPNR